METGKVIFIKVGKEHKMKKNGSLVLFAALFAAGILYINRLPVSAEEAVPEISVQAETLQPMSSQSGTCGEHATWAFDEGNGTLTISGTGEITDPSSKYSFAKKINKVIIEEGVTGIGEYAFASCTNLTEVRIPKSVTSIGAYAFASCTGLTEAQISGPVINIEESVFLECENLKKVTLPETVTGIGECAFAGCYDLAEIRIPASVTSIGDSAFEGCVSLKSVYFEGSAPQFPVESSKLFRRVHAKVYYPADDPSWNETTMKDYGGNLTWVKDQPDDPDTGTDNDPGANGGGGTGSDPGSDPGNGPDTNGGNGTGSDAGTGSGTDAGTGSGTDTGTPQTLPRVTVSYRTHVQTYGWQGWKQNGQMSGTSGESKRLEGIHISLSGNPDLGVQYTTHVQSYGWLPWAKNGEFSGTEGEAKRLEAIEIRLTGADKEKYDVYYRVHAQSYGWLAWAKNGAPAGTAGYAKRLEGIQILVVKKGAAINENMEGISSVQKNAYISATGTVPEIIGQDMPNVSYRTHVQSYGWQNWSYNGQMSGTSGKAKRLEEIRINLSNIPCSGGITYRTHVQSYGWQDWKSNGQMSGTSGEAKRLEAIEIRLTGEMEQRYDVYYRVHAQTYGWLSWARNGEPAGTAGYAKRLEGIQIVLVEKGSGAPANDLGGIVSTGKATFVPK